MLRRHGSLAAVDDQGGWGQVLVHRPAHERGEAAARLQASGADVAGVAQVLLDAGDALTAAATAAEAAAESSGRWTEDFGGAVAVAAALTELQAHAAAVLERAATLRGQVYVSLLQHHSLAEVARAQGVSRQAVHRAARTAGSLRDHPVSLRPLDPRSAGLAPAYQSQSRQQHTEQGGQR